jgi:hypothetical protein
MRAMLNKRLLTLALAGACLAASAQTQPAASSPAKKDLVARILKVQQPGIEMLARQLAEEPAARLLAQAGQVLPQKIAADKREAVAKEIEADARKYVDEAVPVARASALKLAPSTIGALLEEKFTEDELKQILATLESPVFTRFQQLSPDMQKVLTEKLVTESRPAIEPKVRALEASITKRLGLTATAAAPAAAGAAPAAAPRAAASAKK